MENGFETSLCGSRDAVELSSKPSGLARPHVEYMRLKFQIISTLQVDFEDADPEPAAVAPGRSRPASVNRTTMVVFNTQWHGSGAEFSSALRNRIEYTRTELPHGIYQPRGWAVGKIMKMHDCSRASFQNCFHENAWMSSESDEK